LLAAGKIPDALLQNAILKMNQKDNSSSRALTKEALSQNPADTRALYLLMQSYAVEKQTEAGLQKMREYAAQQPSLAPVQQYLGQLLLTNGDLVGARKAFEAAKGADPSLVRADLGLADLDTREGKLVEARKRLAAVIASHPESVESRIFLAQAEDRDGNPAVAIKEYRQALTLDSNNFLALNNLAYLLANANQPDEGLKYAQQAKEVNPKSPAADDTLGWTYFQKGMYSMAMTQFQSAVSRESTPVRQYHLAMACLKAGDVSQGRKALEAALRINPNLPEAQVARQMFGSGK
jgi:tetratricopeptide (TPR) repeat protein